MVIKWVQGSDHLEIGDVKILCTCDVRNELNGRRAPHQVAHAELKDGTEGPPYQPRVFPAGTWTVTGVGARSHPYLAPFFISTDAHQELDEWVVSESQYSKPSGRKVDDWGYGIHCSTSATTLGCIRLNDRQGLAMLIALLGSAWKAGETATLEVLEA